jgi:hypothetical protein
LSEPDEIEAVIKDAGGSLIKAKVPKRGFVTTGDRLYLGTNGLLTSDHNDAIDAMTMAFATTKQRLNGDIAMRDERPDGPE